MSNILLLGAGFVTAPLVDYLNKKNHALIIASQFIDEARRLAVGKKNISPVGLDVTDNQQLTDLVKKADLVVSFVPFQFHVAVARVCIAEKTPMVTASYTSAEMRALHDEAIKADIIILNEIGVDPGIDHMTAMQVIDEAHAKGEKVESFISWCGGLPAPEYSDNPLGYKFSWSPMAVLTAVSNDAKYISQGKQHTIAAKDLLSSMREIDLTDQLKLYGYANRDSVAYKQAYAIPEVKTLLRGTLRYPGFGSVIDAAKKTGLLNNQPFASNPPATWSELMSQLTGLQQNQLSTQLTNDQKINQSFAWLGCFSEQAIHGDSPIAAFCNLLTDKLAYAAGECDMIAMQHRMLLVDKQGNKTCHMSTLIEKGEKNGFSAMAKTVGYPAAIAADLILSGQINRKGVVIPVSKDIYQPVLAALADLNIKMQHEIVNDQPEKNFLNNL